MTIIVEDGSIVTGANSYVTEAELTAFAAARGVTVSGDPEELLIKAMDYIESREFIGIKYDPDQSLQWPRSRVVIDTYARDYDEIPQELKNAQILGALAIDEGNDPLANAERVEKSVKVGAIEIEYEAGRSSTILSKLDASLRKLLASGSSGGINFIVNRG